MYETPEDWPMWIRAALPLITPVMRAIGLATSVRDRISAGGRLDRSRSLHSYGSARRAETRVSDEVATLPPRFVERRQFVGVANRV